MSMDELARLVEYSKGTIYHHFPCKEDLALAVANNSLRRRAELFETACSFRGNSRQRIRALGFASMSFAIQNAEYFNIEMTLKSDSFWEKATEPRRAEHRELGARCVGAIRDIILDGITSGDLAPETRHEHISFALISVSMGSHAAASECDIRELCGITDPIVAIRRNQDIICDGFGWKPLSNDFDFSATDARIKAELFPDATWFDENSPSERSHR